MELKNVLNFLKELSRNNNKEWFHANKQVYQAALADFTTFTEALISKIAGFDKDITSLSPKECIFRIYRDVRFSPDKTPYKTNFGAAFMKGGKKSPFAAYYVHLEEVSSKFKTMNPFIQFLNRAVSNKS